MKISILSDLHFGFSLDNETENDAFVCAKEAIEKSLESDIILIAGDVFDTRTPDTETLTKTIEILIKPVVKPNKVRLLEGVNKDLRTLSVINTMGIPVVAIHGTHERRIKGLMNPIQVLEKAGLLIYLHCNGVVFQKGNERVCIQGMSGVPDQYAGTVMKQWSPKPLPDCFNVLMLHQSISKFMYAPHTMDIETIPKGFDLYICGHLHESKKTLYHNIPFLIPGSLIQTKMNKESVQKKGFFTVSFYLQQPDVPEERRIIRDLGIPLSFITQKKKSAPVIEWIEIENQRRFYYLEFDKTSKENIEKKVHDVLNQEHKIKPIIRIKFKGEQDFETEITTKFSSSALISFKSEFEKEKIDIKNIEELKLSAQELGRKLLLENLERFQLNPQMFETIFELLIHDKLESIVEVLKGKKVKYEIDKLNQVKENKISNLGTNVGDFLK